MPLSSKKKSEMRKWLLSGMAKLWRNYNRKTAKLFNKFFSNIVTNLNISQFNKTDLMFEKLSDPVINAIVKCRAHPSIVAIKEKCTSKSKFNFSFHEKAD